MIAAMLADLAAGKAAKLAGNVLAFLWRHAGTIAIAVLVGVVALQARRIESQRDLMATMTTELSDATDANRTARELIADLQATNAELAEGRAADRAAAAEAIAEIEQHRDRLTADIITERRARSALYHADPIAADWSRQPVPGPVADRLRR